MDKYGLIGYPLGHSFSKGYFNEKFESEGIDAEYSNFEISSIEALNAIIAANPNLKGFNVTIPYKQQVIPFLKEMSNEAKAIGAVNVVKVTRKGNNVTLKGYNSDCIGFSRSIEPMLAPYHKKALILGTGGASKAVKYALENLGLETKYVSRTVKDGCFTYNELTPATLHEYNVIVNCTPLGMYPNIEQCPQIPYEALDNTNLLYDLIYNPDQTLFLKKGKEQGAQTKNGLEMLLLQAFASWEFWQQ